MSAWQEIQPILRRALGFTGVERERFLAKACAGNSTLLRELEHHLAYNTVGQIPGESTPRISLPERAGAYRIVREIGRGGMGVVCLAERSDHEYHRTVAIKLIQNGKHAARFAKLFWRERQILAQLDHPNIARLFDGGTNEAGEPYYVMEFVEGEPVNIYCARHALAIRETLELFLAICSAVAHAHRNLVIHRDLKPGNILVTKDGTPKLLDFGLAKILNEEADHQTETASMLLTPTYASPEQVRSDPLTVATDIYSLGVLLYELLAGEHPYWTPGGAVTLLRAVLEESPKPFEQRGVKVPADLEKIVFKAMRKEPERRYPTAEEFSRDIRRYLDGFPVEAAPDTFWYRLQKFVQRERLAAAAAALLVLIVVTSGLAIWREKQRAERRFEQVRQLAHSVVFEMHDSIENLPGSTSARQLLVSRALQYLNALAEDRGNDDGLTLELAQAYRKIADAQGNPAMANLGDRAGARNSYEHARTLLVGLLKKDPNRSDVRRLLGDVDEAIAEILPENHVSDIKKFRTEAVALLEAVARTETGIQATKDLAWVRYEVAYEKTTREDYRGSLPEWQLALSDYSKIAQFERGSGISLQNLALVEKRMAGVYYALGDFANSIAYDGKAAAMDQARITANPHNQTARMDLSFDLLEIGWCQYQTGDLVQANHTLDRTLALVRRIAAADPRDLRAQGHLETVLHKSSMAKLATGARAEALSLQVQAAKIGRHLHQHDPKDITSAGCFALDLYGLGSIQRSLAQARPLVGANHWRAALFHFREAQALAAALPPQAFEDPNDRRTLSDLPLRIRECLKYTEALTQSNNPSNSGEVK